jgi:hypothetical protein
MNIPRICIVAAIAAATAAAVGASMASCAQAPPNITTQSLRQSQKMDVVCIQVNDTLGNPLDGGPVPVGEGQCAPVAANVVGQTLPFHLFALVTQTTLGAIAVVDLTAGAVVDVDRSTPGVDFVPVGANPTDVAVSHDGALSFVASADPNKMAIYAIDNHRILGDSNGIDAGALRLTDLAACALPQPPQALAIVPTTAAGASEAGAPGGSYALVALLRASGGAPAAIVAIDPVALSSAQPGALPSCTSIGAVLGGAVLASGSPSVADAGAVAWPDGVPYGDAGGSPVPGCLGAAGGTGGMGASDGGGAAIDAGASAGDVGDASAGVGSLPLGPPHPTSIAMRGDVPILYVADDAVPLVHVIDLHDPSHPVEMEPLQATSVADPSRRVSVGSIAISPPTRDYTTYLYAVDALQGTVMVYDVTDPANPVRTPLLRPHPELNPLAPPDRLTFSAPVASVAFVEHDWPVASQTDPNHFHQYTGLLCNPNPNAHPDAGAFVDNGAYYRVDQVSLIQSMDTLGGTVQSLPTRLRGIFGFATLSNGNVVTIDVDDWDAPCRRPDPMAVGPNVDPVTLVAYDGGITGALDVPQTAPGPGDTDPYHAPLTYNPVLGDSPAVTLEAFFPVSAPQRIRSNSLLRNDPITGLHIPNLLGVPQLFNATGAPVAASGNGASPLLLPAPLPPGYIDPTYLSNPTEPNPNARTFTVPELGVAGPSGGPIPDVLFPGSLDTGPAGVRISFDDPTAHQDQDWTVTYEGALPTVAGIAAELASTDGYRTLTLSAPGAGFCARGIEDWSFGKLRAGTMIAALGDAFGASPPTGIDEPDLASWTSDYVEIVDDPLPVTDPYWSEGSGVNDCWDGDLADPDPKSQTSSLGAARYNFCQENFSTAANADAFLARDLPILSAHDDSLVVGRFGWVTPSEETTSRVIVSADPSNAPFLRATSCCFHHTAGFKVRTGGEWVTVGSGVGLLHRVVKAADGSCVPSCDPRMALMNARAFDVPWATAHPVQLPDGTSIAACTPPSPLPTFTRDSPLAMRNPMFSFVVWGGCVPTPAGSPEHTVATRDLTWRFSMRGSFAPQTVSLVSPGSGGGVNPQSMRFIDSLGQLAVVDSEAQGLVLIDLNLVAVAHNYF